MKEEKEKNKKSIEKILYIPHGSDERKAGTQIQAIKSELYIPHGSDERGYVWVTVGYGWLSLYPTWFRWKILQERI